MSILSGVRVVEFEGIGPCPFCGMLLADLGADVILIERKDAAAGRHGPAAIFKRGKRSIALDLKTETGAKLALDIAGDADALIEGMRPGVMERLGLGPEAVLARNRKLVYGRLTGWGQDGPLAQAAGHDLNYVALSGAAWVSGAAGDAPTPPPTLVGDIGGGALYLAVGLLAGILRARETGEGAVIDAAIVDGSAHMMTLLYALRAVGDMTDERGKSMLDGAHFYATYQCADGEWISIAALEPKFYAELLDRLDLTQHPAFANQFDRGKWPDLKLRLAELFRTESRAYWVDRLQGTDVCFAPVLRPSEAAQDPHMKSRNILRAVDGVLQAAAAPRFNGETPADPKPAPTPGQHTEEILGELGLDARDIAAWRESGVL